MSRFSATPSDENTATTADITPLMARESRLAQPPHKKGEPPLHSRQQLQRQHGSFSPS